MVDSTEGQKHKTYTLGPLHWNHDRLVKLYWANFSEAYRAIREHPGYAAYQTLENMDRSREIFKDSADDLLSAVCTFQDASDDPGFFQRGQRQRLEQLERSVRKSLFAVVTSALALVETTRQTSRQFQIQGYEDRVCETFSENGRHRFIQDLRNAFNHKHFLKPSWQVSLRSNEQVTRFLLKQDILQQYDNWTVLGRQFISRHSDGISVERLILDYREQVQQFHQWFHENVAAAVDELVNDYLSYERLLSRQGAKATWRLILRTAVNSRLDPYAYLDQYFTQEELEKIGSLPKGSKEQVDLMISIVDEYNACDDELRRLVYALFGIR